MKRVAMLVGLGLFGVGCGGAAGEVVRPQDFTGNQALNAPAPVCSGAPSLAKPYVVDLDSEQRTDLEARLSKDVVIVAYDCKSLRVLDRCHVSKVGYEYAGVQRKEDVVQLKNRGEASANLPFSGGKLGAAIENGRALDLATVLVGKRSTVLSKPARSDLQGECDGATHFVASATIGAFSLATGSVGKVSTAAEVFGVGASAKSDSSRDVARHDGSLDACKASKADATSPPDQCGGPLRIELRPFEAAPVAIAKKKDDKAGTKDDRKEDAKGIENPCPAGLVLSKGVCVTETADAPHLCNPNDLKECRAQCEKGSAESCYNVAERLPDTASDAERASFYKKACDLDFGDGCAWFSLYGRPKKEGPATEAGWVAARAAAEKGCKELGSSQSCELLGDIYDYSLDGVPSFRNETASTLAYEWGCRLGSAMSCSSAAASYRRGDGVRVDITKSLSLLQRSCEGGVTDNCADLADVLHDGTDGVPKDEARAFEIGSLTCRRTGGTSGCLTAAEAGMAIKKSDAEVFELLKSECEHGSFNGCEVLADFYANGRGTPKNLEKARAIWKQSCEDFSSDESCAKLGKKSAATKSSAAKPAPAAAKKPKKSKK